MQYYISHAASLKLETVDVWAHLQQKDFVTGRTYTIGKKGIIASHDKCDAYNQAMIDWKKYKNNIHHYTSI